MEHSVLGPRWVYDGCGDPVWAAAVASTIVSGGAGAEESVDRGTAVERREPQVRLRGSGRRGTVLAPHGALHHHEGDAAVTISCGFGELVVVRRVGVRPGSGDTLTATWDEQPDPVVLAALNLA